jgi:hypothetical protein
MCSAQRQHPTFVLVFCVVVVDDDYNLAFSRNSGSIGKRRALVASIMCRAPTSIARNNRTTTTRQRPSLDTIHHRQRQQRQHHQLCIQTTTLLSSAKSHRPRRKITRFRLGSKVGRFGHQKRRCIANCVTLIAANQQQSIVQSTPTDKPTASAPPTKTTTTTTATTTTTRAPATGPCGVHEGMRVEGRVLRRVADLSEQRGDRYWCTTVANCPHSYAARNMLYKHIRAAHAVEPLFEQYTRRPKWLRELELQSERARDQ